jgi:hypothetical protein
MRTRALWSAVAMLLLASAAACAQGNGLYAPADTAKVDPEVEPLPPSPKRRMRDPRGVPIFDAGVVAASAAPVAAVAAVAPDAAVPALVEDASVATTCGSKADPCPMQRFMHGAMETAHTPDTLTAAFTRVAGMSPDPAWAWVAIATRGADLANAGDVSAAKRQCQACHEAYRERYRAIHRTRKL